MSIQVKIQFIKKKEKILKYFLPFRSKDPLEYFWVTTIKINWELFGCSLKLN